MAFLAKIALSIVSAFSFFRSSPVNITLPKLGKLDLDRSAFSPALNNDFMSFKINGDLQGWRKWSLSFLPESAMELLKAKEENDTIIETFSIRNNTNVTCVIPKSLPPEEVKLPDENEGKGMIEKAMKALKSFGLLSKGCLRHTDGWWTYEVCHLKRVRQFHTVTASERAEMIREGQKKIPQVGSISGEYLLGRYLPNSPNATRIRFGNVFSVNYRDGYRCKTVDRGTVSRSTEVRFECSEHRLAPHVIEVYEDLICHYVLIIGTPALCSIPSFKSRNRPRQAILCVDKELRRVPQPIKPIQRDNSRKSKLWRLTELVDSIDIFPLLKQALSELLKAEIRMDNSGNQPSQLPGRTLLEELGELKARSKQQSLVTDLENQSAAKGPDNENEVDIEKGKGFVFQNREEL